MLISRAICFQIGACGISLERRMAMGQSISLYSPNFMLHAASQGVLNFHVVHIPDAVSHCFLQAQALLEQSAARSKGIGNAPPPPASRGLKGDRGLEITLPWGFETCCNFCNFLNARHHAASHVFFGIYFRKAVQWVGRHRCPFATKGGPVKGCSIKFKSKLCLRWSRFVIHMFEQPLRQLVPWKKNRRDLVRLQGSAAAAVLGFAPSAAAGLSSWLWGQHPACELPADRIRIGQGFH